MSRRGRGRQSSGSRPASAGVVAFTCALIAAAPLVGWASATAGTASISAAQHARIPLHRWRRRRLGAPRLFSIHRRPQTVLARRIGVLPTLPFELCTRPVLPCGRGGQASRRVGDARYEAVRGPRGNPVLLSRVGPAGSDRWRSGQRRAGTPAGRKVLRDLDRPRELDCGRGPCSRTQPAIRSMPSVRLTGSRRRRRAAAWSGLRRRGPPRCAPGGAG